MRLLILHLDERMERQLKELLRLRDMAVSDRNLRNAIERVLDERVPEHLERARHFALRQKVAARRADDVPKPA